MEFNNNGTLYYSIPKTTNITNIAGFDLDDTLITPISGNKFATNKDDWKFLYDNTVSVLNDLNSKGYTIVIFTNQGGVSKNGIGINNIITKINNIRSKFDFAINVLIAIDDDYYRKPMTGMWEFLCNNIKLIEITKESFYCGDAAGRVYGKKKKDFSESDLYFAHNIGIKFYTPNKLFDHPVACRQLIVTDNINIDKYYNNTMSTIEKGNEQEMIILVGRPSSGKSSFAKKYYYDYVYVNQDTLKTHMKCKKLANEAASVGKKIIIDNTNGTKSTRKEFIDIANKHNIPVKIYVFDIPLELSKHLNYVRTQLLAGKIKLIPKIVYNMYEKRYETPTNDEGIIIHIPFIPDINENNKKIYHYNYF